MLNLVLIGEQWVANEAYIISLVIFCFFDVFPTTKPAKVSLERDSIGIDLGLAHLANLPKGLYIFQMFFVHLAKLPTRL